MKKMRWLASLLCIMMVVCSLPVLQVSAAMGDTDASIASILGVDTAINVYDVQVDADFDGTDVATEASATTYTADGVEFSGESSTSSAWMIAPTNDFWTNTNAVVIKAKVGVGNRLTIYTEGGERTNDDGKNVARTSLIVADNRVYVSNASEGTEAGKVDGEIFLVGDEWFELMVVHKDTAIELYVKNDHTNESYDSTGGVWTKLNFDGTLPYDHGHAGSTAAHHFYVGNKVGADGNKSYLKSFSVYQEDARIYTIEEALSTYPTSFSEAVVTDPITMTASRNAWNFANSTMTSYKRDGGFSTPSGATFTSEGLDLSGTNGTDSWKFSAFAGWNPVSLENSYGGFRAFYAKVKGDVTISYLMSDNQYMNKLRSVAGEKLSESNTSVDASIKAGNKGYSLSREAFTYDPEVNSGEWVEYLIVPRNTNTSVVYAKSETGTNGGWVKAIGIEAYSYVPKSEANATTYNTNNGTSVTYDADVYAENRKNGISFSGSGVVAEWKTIDFNNDTYTLVASDDESKPAAATHLWYGEEFNEEPEASKVLFGSAVSIENGVAYAPVKYANAAAGIEATNGGINFYDEAIPVGGYAEFRMKSNGVKSIEFDDGTSRWNTSLNCDYSSFPGTNVKNGGYMADSDMAWRTWRFVRSANGYSVYSKADGDTGWRIHATDGISGEAGSRVRIAINFYGNADGVSDGNGMLDYMRIYGTEARPEDGGEGGGDSGEDQEPEVDVMDTIQEVLQDGVKRSSATAGDTVAKSKTDDLYATSHDWNFANSTMETYSRSGNGSLALPEGAKLTAEGLDLSGTEGVGEWKYHPHSSWSFVNGAGGSTTVLRAGYVKVKGDVTIAFTGSEHRRLISVHTKPNAATTSGNDAKATTFVPDQNWVEYIFVARNSNSINIWAKKASDAAWVYYGNSGSTELISDATPNKGLHFSGTGVVALWKTFEFNENGYNASYPDVKLIAANTETIPATADTLVYGAEFDAVPERAVLGAASSVENGVLSAKTTVANESLGIAAAQGDIKFNGVKIPENGYAEFKVKGNGTIEMLFDDGTNKFTMSRLPADNYSIQGTAITAFANFINDSDMAWRTYRLVRTSNGYSCYSKAEDDTAWRIVGTAADSSKVASAGNGAYTYFRFHSNCDGVSEGNGQLDYLRIYGTQADKEAFENEEEPGGSGGEGGGDTPDVSAMDTIYEVLQDGVKRSAATAGDTVAKSKTDDLYATSHDWNFANSTMETYSRSGNGSLAMPEGAKLTAEGLDLSGTEGVGEWKYHPFASWSFVNGAGGSNIILRAGYVKVKGDVTISFTGAEHKRLISVHTKPGTATTSGNDAKETTFVPDQGWVEYIFIERNSNNVNIWAKKEADSVWAYYGTSGSTESVTNATPNRGLHFSGTGVVAGWKTFEFNENGYNAAYPDVALIATDKEAAPDGANTLWFAEEFNEMPSYVPAPVFGPAASVANGVLETKATVKNEELGTENATATLQYNNLVIPVGGYAEFKVKGNGTIEATFDDGTNKFNMHRYPADNYSIQGTATTTFANFVNDSDMAWRTYRVARTAEGYSFYSKADGDTGWRIMGVASEESKVASDGKGARIYFRFHTNCDGVSVGNGQLDYLRIYAAAPKGGIAITDGYTAEAVADGAVLTNADNLHVVIDGSITSGKLIVANYKGKVMKKIQTFDVSELNGGALVNAKDGLNRNIKVFLWDSVEGNSKALADAISLSYRN